MAKEGVSICITAYKAAKFIKQTLDSVQAQTWFKDHDNYEILVGIDNCQETLKCVRRIMCRYKNIRVFMMKSNKGTYVTTNTIMSIAQYEGLIRFDSDDLMNPDMVEVIMKNKEGYDTVHFNYQNFGRKTNVQKSCGQVYMKKSIFEKFGGYKPWVCSGDAELECRIRNLTKDLYLKDILFKRRVHDSNLTVAADTNMRSTLRKKYLAQIRRDIKKESEAIIDCQTNDYEEVFPIANAVQNKKVIYTCISGQYDVLMEPKVLSDGYDYVCFTDQNFTSDVWEIRPIPQELMSLTQVKRQRAIKILAHKYLPEYEFSVWIDGNTDILGDLNEYVSMRCGKEGTSIYVGTHPNRSCIYREAEVCIKMKKDTPENIKKQTNRYREEGFPANYGLPQTCILLRYHNDINCIKFMEGWWKEVEEGSHRDQLSFSYVMWKNKDVNVEMLPKTLFNCKWFKWNAGHKKYVRVAPRAEQIEKVASRASGVTVKKIDATKLRARKIYGNTQLGLNTWYN